MRISDWSSDVCSSDLEGHHRRQAEEEAEEGRALRQGARAGGAQQRRQHHGRTEEVDRAGKERRQAPLTTRPCGACRPAAPRPSRIPPRDRPRGRRGAAARCSRSEEHTSELQSLMRISYAVFCLKNKNTI